MKRNSVMLTAVALSVAALVAACGGSGGGGGGDPAPVVQAPTAVTVTGVAATGAPMSGATIEVRDATNVAVASTTAAQDGSYSLTIPATAQAPFVITASKDNVVLYSPMASTDVTTVNVTPITTLVAAQLSPTGDPAQLSSQISAGTATVGTAEVQQVVAAIVQALAPLMQAVGAGAVDPISGSFAANGSGYDQALNSLSISIHPTGTSSNITVSVKAAVPEGQQPPEISFASGSTPPPLPQAVATATLPPANTDSMVASFISKLQQCYAVPLAQRATGTTTVVASACRESFFGNDPATYRHNGAVVSSTQAFSGLWRQGATGLQITKPQVEFLNTTGEMLVSWTNTTTAGDVSFSRAWLKPENGQLKAYGNQYNYTFNVRPIAESRELVNTPVSYHSTGFNIDVPNAVVGGVPVFDRVIVTSPDGRVITLRPTAGLSYMPIENNGALTGTSILRIAGKFFDAGLANRQPRQLSGENIVWASNPAGVATDWTETEIRDAQSLGRWKADFFVAGNTGSTPSHTQYAVVTSRPLTPAEISQRAFATLTPGVRAAVVGESNATGYIQLGEGDPVDISADGGAPGWVVPAGAAAPTTVQAQGFVPGTPIIRWNDNTGVGTSQRTAIVPCAAQGSSDPHCSSTGAPGTYSGAARLNLIQFIALDEEDMQWLSSIGLFKPALP